VDIDDGSPGTKWLLAIVFEQRCVKPRCASKVVDFFRRDDGDPPAGAIITPAQQEKTRSCEIYIRVHALTNSEVNPRIEVCL
jgi:hypothetical protein